MPLPCPGPAPISLLDIQNEFGGTYLDGTYTQIIEYYRGGSYVPDTTENANIPKSGQISFDNFFCSSQEIVIEIGNSTNVDVRALFGTTKWYSLARKRLIVRSGATIGPSVAYGLPANNSTGYAMRIFNDFSGTFILENRGSIQGAGGRFGGSTILSGEARTNKNYGGDGGNAIYIGSGNKTVSINNLGAIYGGGGGGGAGTSNASATQNYSYQNNNVRISLTTNGGTIGGGLGQGYNQSRTSSSGSLGGGNYTITFDNYAWANYEMYYPPNSNIRITNNSAYTRAMYFGSNSTISVSQTSSGIGNIGSDGCIYLYPNIKTNNCGFIFNGRGLGGMYINGSNSSVNVSFGNGSSGCYQLTKDPNQVVNGSTNPSSNNTFGGFYAVVNQSGGGPATTDNQVNLAGNWGSLRTTMPAAPSGSTDSGAGGDWGQSGSNSTSGNLGGNAGAAIVNGSFYANYINTGTIAGSVA